MANNAASLSKFGSANDTSIWNQMITENKVIIFLSDCACVSPRVK